MSFFFNLLSLAFLVPVSTFADGHNHNGDCTGSTISNPFTTSFFQAPETPVHSCLSESDAIQYLESNRVDISSFPEETYVCGESALARMATFLKYFESVEILDNELPGFVDNSITRVLKNPWDFFSSSYEQIRYYESKRSLASFSPHSRVMNISQATIAMEPIAAVTVLIHEAAHANPDDPGHEACYIGELKYTYGACDGIMTDQMKSAGAYVVQFWFAWLFSKFDSNLSISERQYLNKLAHETISQRLNHVFDFAYFNDLFFRVDSLTGLAKVLDPVTGEWKVTHDIDSSDPIIGTEFSELYLGPVHFHESGRVSGWDSVQWTQADFSRVPFGGYISNVSSLRKMFNFEDRITRNGLLTRDGRLYVETTNLENEGAREFVPVPGTEGRSLQSFGSLTGPISFFLFENGLLKFLEGTREMELEMTGAAPESFYNVFESIRGTELFSIDQSSRRLLLGEKLSITYGFMQELSEIRWHIDPLQNISGRSQKYQEGVSFRAVLSDTGQLSYTRRSKKHDTQRRLTDPDRVILHLETHGASDFSIGRSVDLMERYEVLLGLSEQRILFEQSCEVETAFLEPWLHRWMGVDSSGRLVLSDSHEDCRVLDHGVETARLVPRSISDSVHGYPEANLEVTGIDGEVTLMRPYEDFQYWSLAAQPEQQTFTSILLE